MLAADVASYTRLVEEDTAATVTAWCDARASILEPGIAQHDGRIVKFTGDGFLAEFPTVQAAVQCAIELQAGLTPSPLTFRMGVSMGDIIDDGLDVHGEGVNIAARLESLAEEGGVCISGDVYHQVRNRIEATFDDWGEQEVKHVSQPVRVYAIRQPGKSKAKSPPHHAPQKSRNFAHAIALLVLITIIGTAIYAYAPFDTPDHTPTGPRLAVLPFKNISGNPDEDFFADGLTKDINAHLSKFSNLFVIAPYSVVGFRDSGNCETIRTTLNADYILGGSVRRDADHLRITTAFTDASTCRQLKSPGPFDSDLNIANVLDIQLEIAQKVVAEIGSADAPLFNVQVQKQLLSQAPESIAAYDCVLLSYWFYETFAAGRHQRARACLELAVQSEPDYSLGWSRLAFSYLEAKKYAIDTPADWAEKARTAAKHAIDIDPDNPDAYYALAILTQMTTQDKTVFGNMAEKAVELNPNDAFVLADLGTWMGYSGAWERGKEWVSRSKLLNPKHQGWVDNIWHLHHYLKGEYQQSRDVALKMNLPGNYMVQAGLTAAYAMNGEADKATVALAHLLDLRPDYAQDPRAPFRARGMPKQLINGLMDGLQKAGLEIAAP